MPENLSKQTNEQKIAQYLRTNSEGGDDDELSDQLGIRPRQQVNQICRLLEARGLVSRSVDYTRGSRGKIVNRWKGDARM